MVGKHSRDPKCAPSERLFKEETKLFDDIRRELPFRTTVARMQQWARKGILNRFTKKRVRLESIRLPFGYGTSHAAIDRFLRAINEMPKPTEKPPKAKARKKLT